MEVKNHYTYDYLASFDRLDENLNSYSNFDEKDEIPNRDSLTYNNGYYVNCYSVFVDIRESSKLPERYKRPTLAKIYRGYISELVAIMQSFACCKEVNIVGDCVSGIFESIKREQVLEVLAVTYTVNSLVKALNYKLKKKGFDPIEIGIGASKGRALMIQAGYKGSGIKDIVWMGDVVNHASNLCSIANKEVYSPIVISKDVFNDLKGYENGHGRLYQDMFTNDYFAKTYYHGNLIRIDMEQWLQEQL